MCVAVVLLATGAHAQDFERIERGRYLATVGDCVACHTVPGGGTPFAGGRPLVTPFGTLVTPNLTPDDETGLGAWTEAQFVDAVQNGIGRQGEHLYPGLPYAYFTQATRADLADIFAYLRTLDPVRNPVVSNQLPFPFDIRAGLVAWNAINFRPGEYRPDTGKDAEWNRGGYLVQGLGHCGACHSPKGVTGGDQTSRALQGGLRQGWFAPNITGDAHRGLGAWSVDDIVEYLKTGTSHLAVADGPMAEVISYSTTRMSDADLHAIATYLKDQPGQSSGPAPLAPDTPAMRAGAAIYADQCSACHAPHGEGVRNLIPALAGAPALQNDDATDLIRVVLQGGQATATDLRQTSPAMPSYGRMLNDAQLAAIVSYVRNSFGNAAPEVTARDVRVLRGTLARATN